MHQIVEYIVGVVFVAQAVQSPTPVLPAIMGGLVMVNAAFADGPLAAFHAVKPQQHRLLDWALAAVIAVAAAQPWISVESGTRLIMIGFAVVLAFITWQTNFEPKAPRQRNKPPVAPIRPVQNSAPSQARATAHSSEATGEKIGRMAGRAAAAGVNAYRRRKKT